jgi:hypothetical protein
MATKEEIYNLSLSALLLAKEVTEISTDRSNEVRVLNIHWDTAFRSTLQDLDLDSLAISADLELIEDLGDDGPWKYAYKYPDNCAFFRKIQSCAQIDNKYTHISKVIGVHDGEKAIFTNEYQAVGVYIPNDMEEQLLPPMAVMAVAYRLAMLSAPLIVGKGARNLRDELQKSYIIAKAEAQEADAAENFNFEEEYQRSEFVMERLS